MKQGIKQRKIVQESEYIVSQLLQRPYSKNKIDDKFNMVDIVNKELKRIIKNHNKFVYKRSKYE